MIVRLCRVGFVAGTAVLVSTLAACSADDVTFADVCRSDDQSKVAVTGYFEMPSAVVCSIHQGDEGSDTRCNIDFVDEPGAEYGDPDHQFTTYVRSGSESGVEVRGDGYEQDDVAVFFDDGTEMDWGTQVTVTGWTSTLYGSCSLEVDKIEPA